MIDLDDDRLAVVLADIGQRLLTGDDAEPATGATRRPVQRPTRLLHRSTALAGLAAAAAVIAVVIVAVAPLRHAVADWLGIGSTRIRVDPASPSTTSELIRTIDDGLELIDRTEVEAATGLVLFGLDGTDLGGPTGFSRMPEGGALIQWADGSTLWIHVETIDADVYFSKLVASAEVVRRLDDLGDSALVVVGGHMLQTPHRTVAADSTVLWRWGELEYRLESDRSTASLIALARQLAATT